MDGSSMDDDEECSFGVSSIEVGGKIADYVCQDYACSSVPDQSCPCGFVSILNYLMITQVKHPSLEYIKIDGKEVNPGSLEFTSQPVSVLRQFVKTRFMNFWTKLKNDPEAAGIDFESDRINILNLLDSLPRFMHLQGIFDSTIKFMVCPEQLLFSYLGIPLLHGYLVDPENESEVYDAMTSWGARRLQGDDSFTEQESALISDYLDSTLETELTLYGLDCVRKEVKEKSLAILYAKGHFRLVYKRQGTLLSLIHSLDELTKFNSLCCWKPVELVDGDEIYLDHKFQPTEGQKNIAKATKLVKDLEEAIRRLDLEDDTEPTKGDKEAAPDGAHDGQLLDGTSAKSPSPGKGMSAPDGDPEEDIYNSFTHFLWNFRTGGSVPYFEGAVKLIQHVGILVLHIPFAFMKKHNKSMAMYIQDHYDSIHERLRQIVADYLVSQKLHTLLNLEPTDVLQQVQFEITDLPEPKCNQSFVDFISHNKMLNGDSTSYVGRNMASGYLDNILYWHMEEN